MYMFEAPYIYLQQAWGDWLNRMPKSKIKSTTSTVSTNSFCYSTINVMVAIITDEVFDVAYNIKAANENNEDIISGMEKTTSSHRQHMTMIDGRTDIATPWAPVGAIKLSIYWALNGAKNL